MKRPAVFVAGLLLSSILAGQQAALPLYQVELSDGGKTFALDKPTLEGGAYVFRGWPEGAKTRIRSANVRKISTWTRNPIQDIAYKIDLVPSGYLLARDNPTLKQGSYVFRTSRDGTVMSVRQSDVRKVTRLTGADAFWAEQSTRGETRIGTLAMQGGSSQAGPEPLSTAGRPAAAGSMAPGAPTSNWIYQGAPGVSDAWAPGNATVASPGDAPMMPAATDGVPAPE